MAGKNDPRRITRYPSSTFHLCVATLPILAILIYFLVLALKQSSFAEDLAQLGDDADVIQEFLDAEGTHIRLLHILYVYLAFFVMWASMAMFLMLFVPQRRALVARYCALGKIVLGDVVYVPKGCLRKAVTCGRSFAPEYSRLSYVHPEDIKKDVDMGRRVVTKTVRTYHPYTRESVAILLLPNLPNSGQPKADIEVDFASFASGDNSRGIMCVVWAWMIFLIVGSILLLYLMVMANEPSDPADFGFFVWGMTVFVITPLTAGVGNMVRWWMYSRWITSGKVVDEAEYETKKNQLGDGEEDMDVDIDGGICMTTVCRNADFGLGNEEAAPETPYASMAK